MEEPRACVVEVTQIVPVEDVPYVAARVAERLGMPLERVRKLIDGRTGPITRPLRPDKADAIAQTFEAAGVTVLIRPAAEDEAPSMAPSSSPAATADPVPTGAPAYVPEQPLERELEPRPEAEPDAEPELEADAEPEPTAEIAADDDATSDAADADDGDPDDAAAATADDAHGVVMEVDEGEREAPSVTESVDPPVLARVDRDRGAALAAAVPLEPDDDDVDETNDPGPFGIEARGEVRVRVEHDPVFDDADGATVDATGPVHGGPRDLPTSASGGPAVLADQPTDQPVDASATGRPSASQGERSPFGDPDTWGGDDPSGGWIIGSRKARRFEVLHDDEPVSELVDDAASDAGDRRDDAEAYEADAHDHAEADAREDAEDRLPWRGTPGIGRESRRPRYDAHTAARSIGRVEVDAPEAPGASDAPDAPDAPDAVLAPAADARVDEPPAEGHPGDAAGAPRVAAAIVPPADTPTAARAPLRAPGVVPVPRPGARTAAGVPTAWRGLGDDEHGPARPVDAQLPRRADEGYDERVERAAAERTTRRRTVMLISLAIALGLFVLAQVWVAGRAAPAFDAGMHRFRDADFGAAQRVWTQLAGAGDANAQFMLGYLSEAGLGRPWSARAAASWYRLAADAGHAEAQWRLGLLYEMGLGVPHDPSAALRWWAAAAAGGHGESAFRLGRARLEGQVGVSDVDGALDAFERALELGWPAARAYRDALVVASSGRPHPDALP